MLESRRDSSITRFSRSLQGEASASVGRRILNDLEQTVTDLSPAPADLQCPVRLEKRDRKLALAGTAVRR